MNARSLLALVLVALLAGCEPPLAPDAPPIARVWMSRCGACHIRVEPDTRSKSYLEDAFKRHQKRVSLTPDEWAQMVDYLAKPETANRQ